MIKFLERALGPFFVVCLILWLYLTLMVLLWRIIFTLQLIK